MSSWAYKLKTNAVDIINSSLGTRISKTETPDNKRREIATYLRENEELNEYLKSPVEISKEKNSELKLDIIIIKALDGKVDAITEALNNREELNNPEIDRIRKLQCEKEKKKMEAKLDEMIQKMGEKDKLQIGEYSGTQKEDIEEHLENVEKIAKLNKWNTDDRKTLEFSKKLKGQAYECFMREILNNDENIPNWNDIKQRMTRKSGKDESVWELVLSLIHISEPTRPY